MRLPDRSCFDRLSLTSNPFVSDIIISTSCYSNSLDCLSSTNNNCSINFAAPGQPTITFLFNTPACINYIRLPSPSNVQQFSSSLYDDNGVQLQPPGTLLSNAADNPIVQPDPNICGYTLSVQLLKTRNNEPPTQVTLDLGACFLNLSAITPAPVPSVSRSRPILLKDCRHSSSNNLRNWLHRW